MINPWAITFEPCQWAQLAPRVAAYVRDHHIVVESFWEMHILGSNHYTMRSGGEEVGFFAIHGGSTIVLFYVRPEFASVAQPLFARVKKYESVTGAMVPTGDEFLLSHCLDDYARLEKQAYFAIYTDRRLPPERVKPIALRRADVNDPADLAAMALSGDFLEGEIKQIQDGLDAEEIYIVTLEGTIVGFGVIQYGTVVPGIASIGMFVLEQHRRQGIAANILEQLKLICRAKGCEVRSGCWYYNHNSKKSMESACAYAKTRLLRFFF